MNPAVVTIRKDFVPGTKNKQKTLAEEEVKETERYHRVDKKKK